MRRSLGSGAPAATVRRAAGGVSAVFPGILPGLRAALATFLAALPTFLGGLAAEALGGSAREAKAQEAAGPLEVVEAFFDAYGQRDLERATALVSEDFVWYAVTADSLVVQARGRDELARSLASYFESVPSARSSVEATLLTGGYIALRERATWTGPDGSDRSAVSLAVYEVRDGLIRRAWYYPAEAPADAPAEGDGDGDDGKEGDEGDDAPRTEATPP